MLKKNTGSQFYIHKNGSKKNAVILLHAYRCNPLQFEELSKLLYEQGYDVYNLRLPGHGLFEADKSIYKIKLKHWTFYLDHFLADLSANYENIHAAGLSLGASLLTYALLQHPGLLKKTVLLNPCIEIKYPYMGLTASFIRFFKKNIKPHGWHKSSSIIDEKIFPTFTAILPVTHGWEIYKLTKKLQRGLNKIKDEVLCYLTINDNDMSFRRNHDLIKNRSGFKLRILEKSFHLIPGDVEKNQVNTQIIKYFQE